MNGSVLITRPRHDIVTTYLHEWSKKLVDMAHKKGMDVFDLEGTKATRINFTSYVTKHNPGVVFLNGHGNATTITGDENKPLVDMQSTINTAVLYARSCDAALQLGHLLVAGSTKAFIGYKRKFVFSYSVAHITKPLQDPLARLFLEPSNLAVSTLLKNHTAEQAHVRSQKAMAKNFRRMVSSEASDEERYAARWLWANINSQVLLGDGLAKMYD